MFVIGRAQQSVALIYTLLGEPKEACFEGRQRKRHLDQGSGQVEQS
jgi:hypothetical protein